VTIFQIKEKTPNNCMRSAAQIGKQKGRSVERPFSEKVSSLNSG
jgi:hypothetical protein